MLATLGPRPLGEAWSFEPKWDGFRAMCFVDRRRASLVSRRRNDLTRLCPGVSVLAEGDLASVVLDGEIVSFRGGQQSFEALQGVMRRQVGVEDVAFLIFDLLWLRGRSLQRTPYLERREELEGLQFQPPVAVSPRFDDGEAVFEQTLRQGYEGVLAKRKTSLYWPGVRTRDWIKTKHWKLEEFLIGGWSRPRPRHGWGLLVGEVDQGGVLRYRGKVEFGISEGVVAALQDRLAPLVRRTSPFGQRVNEPDATYVEPYVSAEIRYLERTSQGRLRHAMFRQIGGRWNHSVGNHADV
jgi:bifunctional non-homologous end joining protein LigD